jgi:CheY-like chemotaxis protein
MSATADTPGETVVLIAEDERPVAEILATIVAEAGYAPVVAAHGRRALELARERWPALLITDLMMPFLAGDELITALRAEAASLGRAAVPAILLTAAGFARARAAGADAVLRKPFDLEDLERLLRRLLPAGS